MRDGVMIEFASPEDAIAAAETLRAMGYDRLEAFTPYPMPELEAKLGLRRTRIPLAVFLAGACGCALAFLIIWFCNAYDYRLNVGGRPFNSLPADIPIMFETTVLIAGITAFVLVFLLSGMPRLHHPVMEVDGFDSASIDRFWLGIEEGGKPVDDEVRSRMTSLGALSIHLLRARPS